MTNAIRGVKAVIKWSYYHAAAIEGYAVTRNRATGAWSLRGTVVAHDAFKLKQKPLVFVAPHDKGAWYWPIEEMSLQDGVVTAQLGNPI